MSSGESRWITGPAAREDVQRLRGESCAIVTGIGTVLADDPRLDVRLSEELTLGRQPLRVVLDRNLRISQRARVLALPGRTLVFTSAAASPAAEALRAAGAEVEGLPLAGPGLDLAALLAALAARECNEVLVEAGPTLAGAMAAAGLADRLVVYLAPSLMGAAARGMFAIPGLARMSERLQWRFTDISPVGDDLRITAEPA